MTVTGAQFRAARLLLGWSQSRLAGEVGVSASNIAKLEGDNSGISVLTVSTIRRVLAEVGVEFTSDGEAGVKLYEAK